MLLILSKSVEGLFESGVETFVVAVHSAIGFDRAGIRNDTLADENSFRTCFVNVGPDSGSDTREQRGAKRRTLGRVHCDKLRREHIRENLPPKRTLRAASGQTNLMDRCKQIGRAHV